MISWLTNAAHWKVRFLIFIILITFFLGFGILWWGFCVFRSLICLFCIIILFTVIAVPINSFVRAFFHRNLVASIMKPFVAGIAAYENLIFILLIIADTASLSLRVLIQCWMLLTVNLFGLKIQFIRRCLWLILKTLNMIPLCTLWMETRATSSYWTTDITDFCDWAGYNFAYVV